MEIFAETERCILREILPEDLEGMYDLDSDPEVHTYLGNTPLTDKAQAADMIDFIRPIYR
ncbi:GNAT family N-acetyltransferase [Pedobacter sp.]|uniref:GNAT family N-acetyltransferase n=1 Tax=Pedobacter sp. TaxID=1411316 RepID=UPI00396CE502